MAVLLADSEPCTPDFLQRVASERWEVSVAPVEGDGRLVPWGWEGSDVPVEGDGGVGE